MFGDIHIPIVPTLREAEVDSYFNAYNCYSTISYFSVRAQDIVSILSFEDSLKYDLH